MKLYLFLKAFSFGVGQVVISFYDDDTDDLLFTSLEDLNEDYLYNFMVFGMYAVDDTLYVVVERR